LNKTGTYVALVGLVPSIALGDAELSAAIDEVFAGIDAASQPAVPSTFTGICLT
jgi:hypothetical protein